MKKLYISCFAIACFAGQVSAQTLSNYQYTVSNQVPTAYFHLDNSLASSVDSNVVLTPFGGGGFTSDVYGNPLKSYFFANQTDNLSVTSTNLINGGGISNTTSTAAGSITFLFKTLGGAPTGQRYLFAGNNTNSNPNASMLSLFIENTNVANGDPNSLKLRFGNNTSTILQASNIVPATWYFFGLTYLESRVPNKAIWYVGRVGEALATGMTTNSPEAVAGDGTGLYIGNRNPPDTAFRNPGNGRVDEFAIWDRELTFTEITDQFAKLPGPSVTNVIVNDSFADGNRTNTGPLQADWWSSNSTNNNSVETYVNQLGLITGTQGRGLHGTFTPQTLGIGDTIKATYTFTTPATVGAGSASTAFKIAMMDFNNAGLAADLASSSTFTNTLYTNLPGYMNDFDVNDAVGSNIGIREHLENTSGRFLGTTAEWLSLGNSPGVGYVFAPNTQYIGVLSITRTEADSVDIFASMSQGATLMDSFAVSDSSGIANHFGMIGFWANSSCFGSTTNVGELVDNGITFSNIKIEVVTFSTPAPTLNIAPDAGNVVLSWTTTGTAGYNLESTPSLSAPVWTGAGSPTVVGSNNFVTNAHSGGAKFYRLHKP